MRFWKFAMRILSMIAILKSRCGVNQVIAHRASETCCYVRQ